MSRKFRSITTGVLIVFVVSFLCCDVLAVADEVVLVRPNLAGNADHYADEDIYFVTCANESIANNAVSCASGRLIPIDTYGWLDNCMISYYDFSLMDCETPRLSAVDEEGKVIISKSIGADKIISLEESLVSNQEIEGNWDDPVETARNMYLLSYEDSIYKSQMLKAISWLKTHRHNEYKCWPEDDCSVEETAKILAYIILSEVTGAKRITYDAQVWLNTRQNLIEDTPWNVHIISDDGASCIFNYDSSTSFTIAENGTKDISITPQYDKMLNLTCNDDVSMTLQTDAEYVMYSILNTEEILYWIPGACWGEDMWETCDTESTIFAAMTNLVSEKKNLAKAHLIEILLDDPIVGKYIPGNNSFYYNAMYLKYLADNSDMRDYLVYRQNNDGSWGDGVPAEKAFNTILILDAFEDKSFGTKKEVVYDGNKWIKDNLPYDWWNDDFLDAMTYINLKDSFRKYVKSVPGIIVMNDIDMTSLELSNPTSALIDNLVYTFSEGLDEYLSIEAEESISVDGKIPVMINQDVKTDGEKYGFLSVYSGNDEIGKIPVIVTNEPSITFSFPDSINMFGVDGKIDLSVKKSGSEFNCRIVSDSPNKLLFENPKIQDAGKYTLRVTLNESKRDDFIYDGTISCTAGGHEYDTPISFTIHQYLSSPFEVKQQEIVADRIKKDHVLTVKNKVDEPIMVEVGFVEVDPFFYFEEDFFEISPMGKHDFKIINDVPAELNYSKNHTIFVEGLGHSDEIGFVINITDEVKSSFPMRILMIVLPILFVPLLGYAGYKGYKKYKAVGNGEEAGEGKGNDKEDKGKEDKGKKKKDKDVKKGKDGKEKGAKKKAKVSKDTMELVKIIEMLNKTLNKTDEEIIEQLKKMGFSEEKINTTMELMKEKKEEGE